MMIIWWVPFIVAIIWATPFVWHWRTVSKRMAAERSERAKHHAALFGSSVQGRKESQEAFPESHYSRAQEIDGLFHIGKFADTIRLAKGLQVDFPGEAEGYLWEIRSLEKLGRVHEAEALQPEFCRALPSKAAILAVFAQLATNQKDWPVAIKRWEAVVAKFPDDMSGYVFLGIALQGSGNAASAEKVFLSAIEHFGPSKEQGLVIHYAQSADKQQNWPEAASVLFQKFLDFSITF